MGMGTGSIISKFVLACCTVAAVVWHVLGGIPQWQATLFGIYSAIGVHYLTETAAYLYRMPIESRWAYLNCVTVAVFWGPLFFIGFAIGLRRAWKEGDHS